MRRARFATALLLVVCIALLPSCSGPTENKSPQNTDLTPAALITEYEHLNTINQSLNEGHWVINQNDYPKPFGTYRSNKVEEKFFCGDVCPQYGQVVLAYTEVSQSNCASVFGDPIYSAYWGPQYHGCSPLTSRYGALTQTGGSSWSLVGEHVTDTTYQFNTPLLFDPATVCRNGGSKIACDAFQAGQHVQVVGLSTGDSILVLTLDVSGI